VVANLALYVLSWYMTQNTEATQLYGAPAMGGIDGQVLHAAWAPNLPTSWPVNGGGW
jgi:hypothetical protein